MSKKRMLSKQQRLYYEQNNKEKVRQELIEITKQTKEIQEKGVSVTSFNPHENSYYT
jgi:hypothetical protein